MAAERSAGFCTHCNNAVTVAKQTKTGLLSRVQSTFSSSANGNWVCTKCGKPATKGFSDNIINIRPPSSPEQADIEPDKAENPPSPPETTVEQKPSAPVMCPECKKPNPSDIEKCSFCDSVIPPGKPHEATCGICANSINFSDEMIGTETRCPTCKEVVVLPEGGKGPTRTANRPPVLNLGADPKRPGVNKAICTQCNYDLTYPKRLSGKNVDCPSCSAKFNLP